MVTIEITGRGIYGKDGIMVPIGTIMTVEREPTQWRKKYKVVADTEGKTLAVNPAMPMSDTPAGAQIQADRVAHARALPAGPMTSYTQPVDSNPPKPRPDTEHAPQTTTLGRDIDADLKAEYEQVFGKKPNGRMKADTMRAAIEDARNGNSDNG